MTVDDKFIVFKRDEWMDFIPNLPGHSQSRAPEPIDDAVVIRTRDVYAGPALHAYAAMVTMISKTLREILPALADRQQQIADYFHERAMEADAHPRPKYPD